MSPEKRPFQKENTLQETNISPKNGILKMMFLFPRWDMLIPWRVPLQKLECHLKTRPFQNENSLSTCIFQGRQVHPPPKNDPPPAEASRFGGSTELYRYLVWGTKCGRFQQNPGRLCTWPCLQREGSEFAQFQVQNIAQFLSVDKFYAYSKCMNSLSRYLSQSVHIFSRTRGRSLRL